MPPVWQLEATPAFACGAYRDDVRNILCAGLTFALWEHARCRTHVRCLERSTQKDQAVPDSGKDPMSRSFPD